MDKILIIWIRKMTFDFGKKTRRLFRSSETDDFTVHTRHGLVHSFPDAEGREKTTLSEELGKGLLSLPLCPCLCFVTGHPEQCKSTVELVIFPPYHPSCRTRRVRNTESVCDAANRGCVCTDWKIRHRKNTSSHMPACLCTFEKRTHTRGLIVTQGIV